MTGHESAEYFTNQTNSPLPLEETIKQIPMNAIVIHISTDTALREGLDRRGKTVDHVSLFDRDQDAVDHLLTSLGRFVDHFNTPELLPSVIINKSN